MVGIASVVQTQWWEWPHVEIHRKWFHYSNYNLFMAKDYVKLVHGTCDELNLHKILVWHENSNKNRKFSQIIILSKKKFQIQGLQQRISISEKSLLCEEWRLITSWKWKQWIKNVLVRASKPFSLQPFQFTLCGGAVCLSSIKINLGSTRPSTLHAN